MPAGSELSVAGAGGEFLEFAGAAAGGATARGGTESGGVTSAVGVSAVGGIGDDSSGSGAAIFVLLAGGAGCSSVGRDAGDFALKMARAAEGPRRKRMAAVTARNATTTPIRTEPVVRSQKR